MSECTHTERAICIVIKKKTTPNLPRRQMMIARLLLLLLFLRFVCVCVSVALSLFLLSLALSFRLFSSSSIWLLLYFSALLLSTDIFMLFISFSSFFRWENRSAHSQWTKRNVRAHTHTHVTRKQRTIFYLIEYKFIINNIRTTDEKYTQQRHKWNGSRKTEFVMTIPFRRGSCYSIFIETA